MSIKLEIPGHKLYTINNIVFDLNGTLANYGQLSSKSVELLMQLSKKANLYVVTADTHNTASQIKETLKDIVIVKVLNGNDTATEKAKFVERLGKNKTVALGNGANDIKMLKESILSFAIIGKEGCYSPLINQADIVVYSINHAMEMLNNPDQIIATLRY